MVDAINTDKRYQIRDLIGAGGMGKVYQAYDRLEKNVIALKQVRLAENQLDFASKANTDDVNKLRLGLAREFSVLATLRHPHIVSVLDYGFDEQSYPYYTMTYIEDAQTIQEYADGKPRETVYQLLIQLLQALQYLHRRNILHRDLKPDNVLVDSDGQVKVMDFGLAQQKDTDPDKNAASDNADEVTGTIQYMAPELFTAGHPSVQSDLYAFGVIAYELLMGKYPYAYENAFTLIYNIMSTDPVYDGVAQPIATWLARCLDKTPTARYADAPETLHAFVDAIGYELPPDTQQLRESFLQAATFVGRDAEMETMTEALQHTIDGAGNFYLISGESGIGKSRLLDEVRIVALVSGATVLRGQGVEGAGMPYQLWRSIARRLLLLVTVNDLEASVLKDIVPDIATLIQRHVTDAPELTGNAYQERLVHTITTLIRRVERPLVLLLEDLQWVNESLDPLKQLLNLKDELTHLMIVATYRTEESTDLQTTLSAMHHITLQRLDVPNIQKLSVSMLGTRGTDEGIMNLLKTETEGNIFFIVETVRALAEEAGRLGDVGRITLPRGILTGGMKTLIRRRLDRVPDTAQTYLSYAAIMGRELDMTVLSKIITANTLAHDDWLNICAENGIIEIREQTWRFVHDKIRETIITDLDHPAPIHQTIAETIEQTYTDTLSDYHETLMTHWREAHNLQQELHYLKHVVHRWLQYDARYRDALSLLSRADEIITEQANVDTDSETQVELLTLKGDAFQRLGQFKDADDAYHEAEQYVTTFSNPTLHAELLKGRANTLYMLGQADEAMQVLEDVIVIQREIDNSETVQQGLSSSLNDLGIMYTHQFRLEDAHTLITEAITIREALQDQRGLANALGSLGMLEARQDNTDDALRHMTQSLEIREQIGDFQGLAHSNNMLGGLQKMMGHLDTSQQYFEESLAICRAIGDQFGMSSNLSNLGTVARARGDLDAAKQYLEEGVKLFDRLGVPHYLVASAAQLVLTHIDLGDIELARDVFIKAVDTAIEHDKQEGYMFTLIAGIALAHADNHLSHAQNWLAFINSIPESFATLSEEIAKQNELITLPNSEQTLSATTMTEEEKIATLRNMLTDAQALLAK